MARIVSFSPYFLVFVKIFKFYLQLCWFPEVKYEQSEVQQELSLQPQCPGRDAVLLLLVWGRMVSFPLSGLETGWGTVLRGSHPPSKPRLRNTPWSCKFCPWFSPWLSGLLNTLAAAEGMGVARKADPALIWRGAQYSLSLLFPKSLKGGKGSKPEQAGALLPGVPAVPLRAGLNRRENWRKAGWSLRPQWSPGSSDQSVMGYKQLSSLSLPQTNGVGRMLLLATPASGDVVEAFQPQSTPTSPSPPCAALHILHPPWLESHHPH